MANLRVFISSTCFDLSVARGQLRTFIEDLGFQPVMSDYNDVLYDPRTHTHTSCISEVNSCDILLVLVGSRFGGRAIPAAIEQIDLEYLKNVSKGNEVINDPKNLSITQLEVLQAISSSIPIATFVDERVWNDHATYERNKGKDIASSIEYASIDKPETAKYIFEFINFLRLRSVNNSIGTYHRYSDIEDSLKKQWSALFQRLLSEQRNKLENARRIENLSEQFEDLKTAILTAIGSGNERDVARGVVKFRRLVDFLSYLFPKQSDFLLKGSPTWPQLLSKLGVVNSVQLSSAMSVNPKRLTWALILKDHTFIGLRYVSLKLYEDDWQDFTKLAPEARRVIYEALDEMRSGFASMHVRRYDVPFNEYYFNNNPETPDESMKRYEVDED